VLRKRRGRLGLADKGREQSWQVRKVPGDQHIARLRPQAITDFRKILDDSEVDALFCEAPNHWHGPATILAPPQPFRMDASCQGDALRIGSRRYPWGIGVHADYRGRGLSARDPDWRNYRPETYISDIFDLLAVADAQT
jgi:hypothetical protein